MRRSPGDVVRLSLDFAPLVEVEEGDRLKSTGGSWYRVIDAHESSRTPHRWLIVAVVLGPADAYDDPEIRTFTFSWYDRGKRPV